MEKIDRYCGGREMAEKEQLWLFPRFYSQVFDLIEVLVCALLFKVSILILKNILCYEGLCCILFTVTCVHILLQE